MKISFFREFCIWIVPPGGAQVRKFRITLARVVILGLITGLLSSAVLLSTGDYARVQLLMAKSELWLRFVSRERDRLRSSEERLTRELDSLRQSNAGVLAYEQEVKGKLEKLATILNSSTSLALKERGEGNKFAKSNAPQVEAGIGGLEVDCGTRCESVVGDDSSKGAVLQNSMLDDVALKGDLVDLLNRYIELFASVPLNIPNEGRVSSGFGLRKSPFHKGSIRMHEGLDFGSPSGSDVLVTAAGTVERVQRNSTYGLFVDVRHNSRVLTRYAHLSKAHVIEGQKISANQRLGLVGSTGRSTGPHLHYEVLVDGKPRNPVRFLELAKQLAEVLL